MPAAMRLGRRRPRHDLRLDRRARGRARDDCDQGRRTRPRRRARAAAWCVASAQPARASPAGDAGVRQRRITRARRTRSGPPRRRGGDPVEGPVARGGPGRGRDGRGIASNDVTARGWALFAAVSVIWGMPYLFIKLAVEEMSPSVVAWSRLAIAAAVLLPIAWKLGALRGLGARWKMLTAFAAVEMAVPWPLIGFGEVRISSSLAAILIAAVPLVVALLALRFDHSEDRK